MSYRTYGRFVYKPQFVDRRSGSPRRSYERRSLPNCDQGRSVALARFDIALIKANRDRAAFRRDPSSGRLSRPPLSEPKVRLTPAREKGARAAARFAPAPDIRRASEEASPLRK